MPADRGSCWAALFAFAVSRHPLASAQRCGITVVVEATAVYATIILVDSVTHPRQHPDMRPHPSRLAEARCIMSDFVVARGA
ncbi:MAG: hypothetical protein ACR2HZ_00375 [Gemmatimonadaceae bacterium]